MTLVFKSQEMPLNQLVFEEIGCAMVDSCPPYLSQEELFEVFMTNFYRHYNSNRAPLGLYFHSNWFKTKQNRAAFRRFLDELVTRQDVWIVSHWYDKSYYPPAIKGRTTTENTRLPYQGGIIVLECDPDLQRKVAEI